MKKYVTWKLEILKISNYVLTASGESEKTDDLSEWLGEENFN